MNLSVKINSGFRMNVSHEVAVTAFVYLKWLGKIQLCWFIKFLGFPHQAFDAWKVRGNKTKTTSLKPSWYLGESRKLFWSFFSVLKLHCTVPHECLPGLLKLYFASILQQESERRPLGLINYGEMFILVSSLVPLSVCESVYVSNTVRNKSASTFDPVLRGVSQGLSRNRHSGCHRQTKHEKGVNINVHCFHTIKSKSVTFP